MNEIKKVKYTFLSVKEGTPAKGYWDQALLTDILNHPLFEEVPIISAMEDGGIVIIPGSYQSDFINQINQSLSRLNWVILIVTSDEESKFPVERISHPNIITWVQYPKQGRHDHYHKLPLGYTTDTRKNLVFYEDKPLDLFFSGQVTHERRMRMYEQLEKINKGIFQAQKGFAQGMDQSAYMTAMSGAKVVPAPSGPVSPDSFRTYEALEAGAMPIADNLSPTGETGYWEYLFDSVVPFSTILDYKDLPGYVDDVLAEYPGPHNRAQAWWIKQKRDLRHAFLDQVGILTEEHVNRGYITAVIPVSPIKSHPSIQVLDETVKTIRKHLNCEIIITFDGVRAEQEDKRDSYEEAIRRALYMCNTEWDATPIIFETHEHQSGMMRKMLHEILTPILLYVEQDTPITPDMEIDWAECVNQIVSGEADIVRFHFESKIPEPHKHMIIGKVEGGFLKTCQWSQRPHLASVAYYRRIINDYFSENAKTMIEDRMHSVAHEAYLKDGIHGWQQHRIKIYHPSGGNIKRSYHLDGREGEEKYDDTYTF